MTKHDDDRIQAEITARHLIQDALDDLTSSRAIWRLVDAVGLLSEQYTGSCGRAYPTGRGYQIIREVVTP